MLQKFWPLCVFFLKKFGLSLLNIVAFFVGMFLWGLTLYPMNLPYLLKLPQDVDYIIGTVFALTFVCIIVVSVRTKWCFETDLFYPQKGEEPRPLFVRIVTSREFIADGIVFAVWMLAISISVGVTSGAPWYSVVLGNVVLVVGGTAAFGLLDCWLYAIARKKANRRLRKREE